MTKRSWTILGGLSGALALALAVSALAIPAPSAALAEEPEAAPATEANTEANADEALDRARDQVQMLDALYKTAVVSITERYQRGQPAIMVAIDVFKAMEDGDHHSARLVDVTGVPMSEGNVPKTDFEKRAAEAILEGKPYYEEVVGEGEDRSLLAATVVPAVHRRCAACHGVEEGDLLGYIRYVVPVN